MTSVALLAAICQCTVVLLTPGAHPAGMPATAYSRWWTSPPQLLIDAGTLAHVGTRDHDAWYATWAVTHELGHLRERTASEDAANCFALAHLGETAIRFGGTPGYVRWLWQRVPASWRSWQRQRCAGDLVRGDPVAP